MRVSRIESGVATEPFDPAFWSVAVALGGAVVYLACLI